MEFLVHIIYTKLLVHAIVSLTYLKDYVLFLRSIYIKHVVVTLFPFKTFYHILL